MPFALLVHTMIDLIKRTVRLVEARVTPRRSLVTLDARTFRLVRSFWWHDAHQESFDREISPYFSALSPRRNYRTIVDAGAAAGLFALAACTAFPAARIVAFEPSSRQRVVLRRNLRLNGFSDRVEVMPMGLWQTAGVLAFRTHGAIGALRSVSDLPSALPFRERVRVTSLDKWTSDRGVTGIDLIKMDVEGAELEAIAGARETLLRDRPDLMVQAYHVRDGARTFERCSDQLRSWGYRVREAPGRAGLLHAVPE